MSNATGSAYNIVIPQIRRFLERADHFISRTFGVGGETCLAEGKIPCKAALLGQSQTNYLFCGIQTNAPIAAMGTFSDRYYRSDPGWTQSHQRAEALHGKTLARLPELTTIPESRGGEPP